MSSNSGLSPPGSSTYASNTLHVGDGTWDSSRDTFLLPNLMGLNFETMRYNGMGNRFRDWPEYHSLILAHGVIAAIVFLGLVPLSLLTVRYYSRWNAFWAFKLHAWFEVLTLFLTTVLFVLGYFAVGPERSLTNPHHGIGVAIYVLVIFQVLWGWFVHKRERAKMRHHVPLKLVIHRWLGWALAILGIVQVALGLTLYGSPKVLFILYSVGAFALLAAFFVLSYMYDSEGYYMGSDYDSRHSYMSGPSVVEDNHHSNFGRMAAAGVAGAGLAQAFRRRPRSRNGDRVYDNSHASYIDDKDSDDGPRRSGWGKRLLEIGAIAGAAAAAKRIFSRRRARDADNESGRYSRAHTRSDSMSEATMSRLEEGRPPRSHQAPLHRPPTGPQVPDPVEDSYQESSFITNEDAGPSHGFRNALLGAGAFAAIRNIFGRGKAKDEKRRVEEIQRRDAEEERIARANSKKYTGDGFFPRRNDRPASFTATDISSTVITQPTGGPAYGRPVASGAIHSQPSDIPPIPPTHGATVSDATTVPYPGRGEEADTASLTDAAAGAAAIGSGATRRRRSSGRQDDEHVESPPVSVKLKMHNDGRHVTLRRLTEEEAAASREARRRERHGSRRRHGSASSLSGTESGTSRWRRVEEMERQQAEQLQREQAAAAAAAAARPTGSPADPANSAGNTPPEAYIPPPMPPPPPAPSSLPYGAGSITSPGTWTGTDASGDYANNRRRRRAERARARQERQQQHGVEFT